MRKFNIAFSICGEGHGHYGRNIEIIRELSKRLPESSITLYLYGDSLEIFKLDKNLPKNVAIKEIPGFRFKYRDDGFLTSLLSTAFNKTNWAVFLETVWLTLFHILTTPLLKMVSLLTKKKILFKNFYKKYFDEFDFAITDLEPLLPRVALIRGKPFLTFDNQHAMLYGDIEIKKFQFKERLEHFFVCTFLKTYHPRSDLSILTTFCEIPIKEKYKNRVVAVGPLFRKDIAKLKGKERYEDFILVYAHNIIRATLFPILSEIKDQKFYVFTKFDDDLKKYQVESEHIKFFQINPDAFIEKLLSCKAVIATAGNTALGEAMFFKKPFFAISLEGQFEQRLNLYLLKKEKWGSGCGLSEVNKEYLNDFIKSIDSYKKNLQKANIEDHTEKITQLMIEKIYRELGL